MMSSKDDVPQEYSECLHLHPISENNYEVVSSTKGPAKVNSQAFRSNWENIFGQRQTVGQA